MRLKHNTKCQTQMIASIIFALFLLVTAGGCSEKHVEKLNVTQQINKYQEEITAFTLELTNSIGYDKNTDLLSITIPPKISHDSLDETELRLAVRGVIFGESAKILLSNFDDYLITGKAYNEIANLDKVDYIEISFVYESNDEDNVIYNPIKYINSNGDVVDKRPEYEPSSIDELYAFEYWFLVDGGPVLRTYYIDADLNISVRSIIPNYATLEDIDIVTEGKLEQQQWNDLISMDIVMAAWRGPSTSVGNEIEHECAPIGNLMLYTRKIPVQGYANPHTGDKAELTNAIIELAIECGLTKIHSKETETAISQH